MDASERFPGYAPCVDKAYPRFVMDWIPTGRLQRGPSVLLYDIQANPLGTAGWSGFACRDSMTSRQRNP